MASIILAALQPASSYVSRLQIQIVTAIKSLICINGYLIKTFLTFGLELCWHFPKLVV